MIVIQIISIGSIVSSLNSKLKDYYLSDMITFDYLKYRVVKIIINEEQQQEFLKDLYSIPPFREKVRKIQIFEKDEYRGSWDRRNILERK